MLAGRSGSLAAFVTMSVVSSLIVRSGCDGSTGALFTSVTTTLKLLVALKGGTPLSVATVVKTLVLGPCASVGVQVIVPEAESMLMPSGGESRLKDSVLVGRSGSVPEAATLRVVSSFTVWLAGTMTLGARFASVTVTPKLLVALKGGRPL